MSPTIQTIMVIIFLVYSTGFALFVGWASGRIEKSPRPVRKPALVTVLCFAVLPLVSLLLLIPRL